MSSRLLREVRLKQSERALALAERWPGRIFRIDSDEDIGREAFEGWTRPVRLRLVENEGQYEMWVCDV